MRKRLQFAMPRVPLQKLKGTPEQQENVEPGTHVATMRRRIAEARQGKQGIKEKPKVPLGGDSKSSEEEFHSSSTDDEDKMHLLGAAAQVHNQNETLDFEDCPQLMEMEPKLQRSTRGRNQTVFVEGDTDGGEEQDLTADIVCQTSSDGSEEKFGRQLEVQAIIHDVDMEQSDQEEAIGNTDVTDNIMDAGIDMADWTIEEDRAQGNMSNFIETQIGGEYGGARPKKIMNRLSRNENQEADFEEIYVKKDRQKSRKAMKNVKHHVQMKRPKKTGTARKVEWGLDESSESDGGWDCDDIPLLSR